MSVKRKVTRNLVFKTITEAAGRILALVFYMALARLLGEEPFGVYSLLYSVAAIAIFIVDPGLNTALIRLAPRKKEHLNETAGAVLGLKLILSALVVVLCLFYGAAAGYGLKMSFLLALMGAQMAGFALMEYAGAIFQAREQMHYETWVMSVGKFAVTIPAIGVVLAGGRLTVVMIAMTLLQIAAVAWAFTWTSRMGVKLDIRFDLKEWGELLKDSIPLGGVMFFTILYSRIDIPLAPFLNISLSDVGYYSAGMKILDVWMAVPTLAMSAFFPTLSSFAALDRGAFAKWANRLVMALFVAGLAGAVAMTLFSQEIVTLVFSDRFLPAVVPLNLLLGASVFIFVRHGFLNALVLDGRQGQAVTLTALAVPVNVAFNFILAPLWGITGMAAAKLIADALLAVSSGYTWFYITRKGAA